MTETFYCLWWERARECGMVQYATEAAARAVATASIGAHVMRIERTLVDPPDVRKWTIAVRFCDGGPWRIVGGEGLTESEAKAKAKAARLNGTSQRWPECRVVELVESLN